MSGAPGSVDRRRAWPQPHHTGFRASAGRCSSSSTAPHSTPATPPVRGPTRGSRRRSAGVWRGCSRRAGERSPALAARPRLTKLLVAEDPDEEEDRAEREEGEDHRERLRDPDRDEPEPDEEAEPDRPEERGDAWRDARGPQVHAGILLGRRLDDLGRLDRQPLLVDLPLGFAGRAVGAALDRAGAFLELAHPRAEPLRLGGVLAVGGAAELKLGPPELGAEPRELRAGGEDVPRGAGAGGRRVEGEAPPVADPFTERRGHAAVLPEISRGNLPGSPGPFHWSASRPGASNRGPTS